MQTLATGHISQTAQPRESSLETLQTTLSQQAATEELVGFTESQLLGTATRHLSAEHLQGNIALVVTRSLKICSLVQGINLIGRDRDCQIRLDDPVISRHHAKILMQGEWLVIGDLDSTNGTYINNKRISADTVLHGGDIVRLGRTEFVVVAACRNAATARHGKKLHSIERTAN